MVLKKASVLKSKDKTVNNPLCLHSKSHMKPLIRSQAVTPRYHTSVELGSVVVMGAPQRVQEGGQVSTDGQREHQRHTDPEGTWTYGEPGGKVSLGRGGSHYNLRYAEFGKLSSSFTAIKVNILRSIRIQI